MHRTAPDFLPCILLLAICTLTNPVLAQTGIPLPALSVDDYQQPRALFNALQLRFASTETDIYLVDDELRIGGDAADLMPGRTLGNLYLEPLRLVTSRNGGQVYPETTTPFILLIDIKTEALSTYQQLERSLGPYERQLTRFTQTSTEARAVTVIVTGNVPKEHMATQVERFVATEASVAELTAGNLNRNLTPLIADDWGSLFQWRGAGTMPLEELQRLEAFGDLARDYDVAVRFRSTPDIQPLWEALRSANISLIETSRVSELAEFLNP